MQQEASPSKHIMASDPSRTYTQQAFCQISARISLGSEVEKKKDIEFGLWVPKAAQKKTVGGVQQETRPGKHVMASAT